MSRAQSIHLLRQCTASFSPRTIGRQSASALRFTPGHTRVRHYSDDKGKEQQVEMEKDQAEGSEVGGAPSTPVLEAQAKLKAKEQEVVDLTGRLRYLQADFLNLQRNAAREKEQTRDYAITRFAGDLLETVDVLSLALKSIPESALAPSTDSSLPNSPSPDPASASDADAAPLPTKSAQAYLIELHTGVEMTHRLLSQTLFKYNVKPFDPTGDKFDPNRHEALYQIPVPGMEAGMVIDCQKVGYTIKDRTLRAAQVGVAADAS